MLLAPWMCELMISLFSGPSYEFTAVYRTLWAPRMPEATQATALYAELARSGRLIRNVGQVEHKIVERKLVGPSGCHKTGRMVIPGASLS